MQPLERLQLQTLFSDSEIDRLQDLLARRLSLCDDEPAELAQALDREIETLISDRKSRLWEILQEDTGPDIGGGSS
jgi:hypothetical protein